MQARTDIGGLDKPVIDAEHENQPDLADKQQTEEEGETLYRLLTAPFERVVVDLVDRHADEKKRRSHDGADQDRVDAEVGVDDIGDKGPEHDERRVRDVDDVEHAKA